jgi:CRP-like cAMP-binding protein
MGCSSSSAVDTKADKLKYIKSTPFMLHFSDEQLASFAEIFTFRRVPKDLEVFHEGDVADKWFIIGAGSVDITMTKGDSRKFLCNKQAGDFFGESAILDEADEKKVDPLSETMRTKTMKKKAAAAAAGGKVRNATATAVEDCELLELGKDVLEKFLRGKPKELRDTIFGIIGRRMENYLAEIPFLSNLSLRERQLLGSMLHYVPLKKNSVLFEEGSIGRNLYIVYQGAVDAVSYKDQMKKDYVVLSTIKEGQIFGEIGLMIAMPRTATIIALNDSLLLELRKEDFQNFLTLAPSCEENFKAMMKKRIAEHFRKYNIPFFAAIPDDKFSILAQHCSVEQFEPDSVIFSEGHPSTTFYIIAHGEVEVSIQKADKGKVKLSKMRPGMYFGEVALVRPEPRSFTVTAASRCVVLAITKSSFDHFFEQVPEAASDFQVKLARYDAELKHVIHHPVGIDFLTKHLEQEYASENINFWKDVQKLKLPVVNDEQRKQECLAIIEKYLKSSSPQEINVRGIMRDECIKKVDEGDYSFEAFSECAQEVQRVMERDSFKRFKQSNLFQEFLVAADSAQQRKAVDPAPKSDPFAKKPSEGSRGSAILPDGPRGSNIISAVLKEMKQKEINEE